MGRRLSHRVVYCVVATSLAACGGGDLNLPNNNAPATLQAVSGNGQEAVVGSRLPQPLAALLTDAAAQPVKGISVAFRFREDFPGAQFDPPTAQTDTTGVASTRVRLGTAVGPYTVEAVVTQGAPGLSTTFGVTAVAKDRGRGGGQGEND